MDYKISEEISDRLKILSALADRTEQKIEKLPEGRITIRARENRSYYYYSSNECLDKYIDSTDKGLIEGLVQKRYLEKVLNCAKREMSVLNRMQKIYPKVLAEDIYTLMPEERRKMVKPIFLSDDQYVQNWLEKPFTPKAFEEGMPVFKTLRGERVRSKSEMIIANKLYMSGIPYKYECPLQVGDEVFHPDFTILRRSDRKEVYYEHCGMMDDPDYAKEMVRRADKYNCSGIVIGSNLFYSFETKRHPLDTDVIDSLIENCFR